MRRTWLALTLLAAACTKAPPAETTPPPAKKADAAPASRTFCPQRALDPPRTVVERPCGTARAVLTDGARTVVIDGPERLFGEPSAANAVRTRSWVRLLPAPFSGSLDATLERSLEAALADQGPDVLEVAMQYLEGAPPVLKDGLQIAGDASYGPLSDLGTRTEGADFNDYLGLRWTYPDGAADQAKPERLHSLDCSGYIRMIWGYRNGVPLAPALSATALSRRAVQMDASTFGVTIIANGEVAGAALERLQPGDLVFFDADPLDGPAIDHVGTALGRDEAGHPRFISSRKSPDGPTLGDLHGASLLDGPGLYARAFRSARRL
jgi:cell wall-associated NlpC family hydrolase